VGSAPSWWATDPVLSRLPSVAELAAVNGTRDGQEFLICSDGRVVAAVNAFLASARMAVRSPLTRVKYARGLAVWLGYLDAVGCHWDEAGVEDVDGWKFWRMTDQANPERVAGSTVLDNLGAVSAFYDWASVRYGVVNPVARRLVRSRGREPVESFAAAPRVVRDRDVKWLDPGGYARWRDVGLGGLGIDGREVSVWRGRNSQRDVAFTDGLYGTGLRLSEWSSVLLVELPGDGGLRGYSTCSLAAACAKGSRGRRYWMPRTVLSGVLAYVEGERAAAVRRAQQAGRYTLDRGGRVVERVLARRRLEVRDGAGASYVVSLDTLAARERARLFHRGPGGLEPACVWLNEDGRPRAAHGWQHTFDVANERVDRAGLSGLAATAHMLRHSFALRWYSVGRLLYERRFAHLGAEELRDFRAQFGDTWYLVRTLLGHADVATTMNVYLEPFRDLDVSLLIEHAHGAAMSQLMAEMFAGHPQVITDPVRVAAVVGMAGVGEAVGDADRVTGADR
jgi:site-specific recombinase XerD